MNFEQMEYIMTVAAERSIVKASEKLHISVSGLSQSITQLENELDITIFNRSRKGTTLTEEGQILFKRASEVLHSISMLKDELFDYKNNHKIHLKILSTPTFASSLQQSLGEFHVEQPNVTIEIEEQDPCEIMGTILHADFDFCFVAQDLEVLKNVKNISYESIRMDRICVVVGKNSPLFHFDYVTQQDVLNMDTGVFKVSSKYYMSKIIKQNNNKIKATTNSVNMLAQIVKEKNTIVYAHESSTKFYPDILTGDLKALPYKENGEFVYKDLWVVYPKNKQLTDESYRFIEIVKSFY